MSLTYDQAKRIDTARGVIIGKRGTEIRYTLERERRWNVGLRKHHMALMGDIRVHAADGRSRCVADWPAAIALAEDYEGEG